MFTFGIWHLVGMWDLGCCQLLAHTNSTYGAAAVRLAEIGELSRYMASPKLSTDWSMELSYEWLRFVFRLDCLTLLPRTRESSIRRIQMLFAP
mmetsp:Transcript_6759/g.10832  ORF Transcript_6759/g.10832 Transcript_6759/m.10832 type:complete len:93 (+) Transcript_6759:1977-2255(+)